jgi:NAD(P)-dependent dehydrogenase (short-subunit alcohol dehydrogenase family)
MGNRLENRVSIVTGAARGMGYAIARALYDEGAKVMIVDIDEQAVTKAATSLDPDSCRVIGRIFGL